MTVHRFTFFVAFIVALIIAISLSSQSRASNSCSQLFTINLTPQFAHPHSYVSELRLRADNFHKETGQPKDLLPMPENEETLDFMIEQLKPVIKKFRGSPAEPYLTDLEKSLLGVKSQGIPYRHYVSIVATWASAMSEQSQFHDEPDRWMSILKRQRRDRVDVNSIENGWDRHYVDLFPRFVFLDTKKNMTFRNLVRFDGQMIIPRAIAVNHKVFGRSDALNQHDFGHFFAAQRRIEQMIKKRQALGLYDADPMVAREQYALQSSLKLEQILNKSVQLPSKSDRLAVDYILFYLLHEHTAVDYLTLHQAVIVLDDMLKDRPLNREMLADFATDTTAFYVKTNFWENYITDGQTFLGSRDEAAPILMKAISWLISNT